MLDMPRATWRSTANGMTPEQRMAFAAAEREDLAYMGAPVSVSASFSASNTITRTTESWLTHGFKAGMRIEVSGSTKNTAGADLYVIASVDATTITITTDSALKNEGAKTVTVSTEIMPDSFHGGQLCRCRRRRYGHEDRRQELGNYGFLAGTKIRIVGIRRNASKTGQFYTIASVNGSTITLTSDAKLVTELGKDVTITPDIKKILILQREDEDICAISNITIDSAGDVDLGSGQVQQHVLTRPQDRFDHRRRHNPDQGRPGDSVNPLNSSATNIAGGNLVGEVAKGYTRDPGLKSLHRPGMAVPP